MNSSTGPHRPSACPGPSDAPSDSSDHFQVTAVVTAAAERGLQPLSLVGPWQD